MAIEVNSGIGITAGFAATIIHPHGHHSVHTGQPKKLAAKGPPARSVTNGACPRALEIQAELHTARYRIVVLEIARVAVRTGLGLGIAKPEILDAC